jgi:hypothetical protein
MPRCEAEQSPEADFLRVSGRSAPKKIRWLESFEVEEANLQSTEYKTLGSCIDARDGNNIP